MSLLSTLTQEAGSVAASLRDYVGGNGLRLGVTGLSRAGKTVFITALIQNLVAGGRLPVFRVLAEGRLTGARLEPQPDDQVPRFAYEEHLAALTGANRHWPLSTRRISEVRVTLEYASTRTWGTRNRRLTLDIVDYPGEWLLDLPLLAKSYAQWSRENLEASAAAARAPLAQDWRGFLATLDAARAASEDDARRAAELFTAYLRAARADRFALSTLPPGRFLMPGDLEGSPALTFAPLMLAEGAEARAGSLADMMERRYEAYKRHVVQPFFRDHFARLDRQIVLVDALAALNSGPAAVRDLETALADVLAAFRAGRASLLARVFRPRIDRILFAATKADHLLNASHDRLEAILRLLVDRAYSRAEGLGAETDVIALAAVRATREATVKQGGDSLPAIVGTPLAGETLDDEHFDGASEAAVFPGELPLDPRDVFRGDGLALAEAEARLRFLRFRPPKGAVAADGSAQPLPHIRLDRALQFLLGDRLQ